MASLSQNPGNFEYIFVISVPGESIKTGIFWLKDGNRCWHWGSVLSVKFSQNGKFLIAAGDAGRLQFWDPIKGVTFLLRYHFGTGSWLDLMPDGRFNASPEGLRFLRYTEMATLKSFNAEDLVDKFYRPSDIEILLKEYTMN